MTFVPHHNRYVRCTKNTYIAGNLIKQAMHFFQIMQILRTVALKVGQALGSSMWNILLVSMTIIKAQFYKWGPVQIISKTTIVKVVIQYSRCTSSCINTYLHLCISNIVGVTFIFRCPLDKSTPFPPPPPLSLWIMLFSHHLVSCGTW